VKLHKLGTMLTSKMKICVWFALVCNATAYRNYYNNMPNGNQIQGDIAHINGNYKTFTTFGQDYRTAGGTWSAYCQKDSDGDGATNGVELGDPNCAWVVNRGAPSGTYQSDPNDPNSTPAAAVVTSAPVTAAPVAAGTTAAPIAAGSTRAPIAAGSTAAPVASNTGGTTPDSKTVVQSSTSSMSGSAVLVGGLAFVTAGAAAYYVTKKKPQSQQMMAPSSQQQQNMMMNQRTQSFQV